MKKKLFRWAVVVLLMPIWCIIGIAAFCFPCCVLVMLSPYKAIADSISYLAGGIDKEQWKYEMSECFFLFTSPFWAAYSTPAEFIKTGKFSV